MYYHTTYLEQSGAQRHKAKESKWSITSIVQHQIDTQTQLAGALIKKTVKITTFFVLPASRCLRLCENNKKNMSITLNYIKIAVFLYVSFVGLEVIFHNGHCMLPDGTSPDS